MLNNSIDDRLDRLLDEYWNEFKDMFPTMDFQDESKEKICNRIKQCLQKHISAEELFDLNKGYKY